MFMARCLRDPKTRAGRWLPLALAVTFAHVLVLLLSTPALALPSIHYWFDSDDNPGRAYGTSFQSLDEGFGWACRVYGDPSAHEAVVYNYDQSIGSSVTTLSLPHEVEYEGQTYRVVGLVAYNDAVGSNDLCESNLGSGTNVRHLVIPSSVRFIGMCAFNGYEQLESVTFEDGIQLEEVEAGAFADCVSLTQLAFPSSVTHISKDVLCGCTSLEDVSFPAYGEVDPEVFGYEDVSGNIDLSYPALRSIENAPATLRFHDAPQQLASVSFRPGLTEVRGLSASVYSDNYRFNGLTNVTLPEGLKSVNGFEFCYNLRTINLPSSLVAIGGFAGDESLDPSFDLPSSVKVIWPGAFEDCSQLFSSWKKLPANIEYVGDGAFAYCTSLKADIVHPGYLASQYIGTNINSLTFSRSGKLNQQVYTLACSEEEEVDSWLEGYGDDGSFDNANVVNADDYTWNGARPFREMERLKSINVLGGSKDSVWSEDGILYTAKYESIWAGFSKCGRGTSCLAKYPAGKQGSSYTVSATAKSIAPYAFEDCTLSAIHIPVTVEKLLKDWVANSDDYFTALDGMASVPTVYYVANSYVEGALTNPIYEEMGVGYEGLLATEAGPAVAVTYDLAGGTNAAGNPTSIAGGSSATLKAPTRSGYDFAGWVRKGTTKVLANNVLTPQEEELVARSVTVVATWTAAKKAQTIKAANKSVAMGKTVSLGASTNGGGKLTYSLDAQSKKIIKVDSTGKVTPLKVGKATVTIKAAANGSYLAASKTVTVTVSKGANPLAAKASKASVTVSLAKVKKAKVTIASNVKVTKKGAGKLTYANASSNKTAKKFVVNKSTGKVTVPKGTKKGTYALKVKVTAAGNANYKAGSKTITYKVVVK